MKLHEQDNITYKDFKLVMMQYVYIRGGVLRVNFFNINNLTDVLK